MRGSMRHRASEALITAVLSLVLMLLFAWTSGICGVYADSMDPDEGLPAEEMQCESHPGSIITPDMIPYGASSRGKRKGITLNSESTGSYIPLAVIVVGFGNCGYDNSYDWGNIIFGDDMGLRSYFLDMSAGRFTYEPAGETSAYGTGGNANIADQADDGIVHVTLDRDRSDWIDFNDRTACRALAASFSEAVMKASAYIDFTSFDKNENGKIEREELAVLFIVGGYDAGGVVTEACEGLLMRSHQWDIDSILKTFDITDVSVPEITKDGRTVKVNQYCAVPEKVNWKDSEGTVNTAHGRLGAMAHELCHHLGLPDMYDMSGKAAGERPWIKYTVMNTSLMGSGSWANDSDGSFVPCSLDPWSRTELRWLEPSVIDDQGLYSATAENYISRTAPTVLRVDLPGSDKEYYLLEYRRLDRWDKGLQKKYLVNTYDKKSGMILWHIDGRVLDACTEKISGGVKRYKQINNTDRRPAVIPLFMETDEEGKYTLLGNNKVYNMNPFFDYFRWTKYKDVIGTDIDLPEYTGDTITAGPAESRRLSGIRIQLVSNSGGDNMVVRYLTAKPPQPETDEEPAPQEQEEEQKKDEQEKPKLKFGTLFFRSAKQGKQSITLKWKSAGAAKYVIYGNLCSKGKKFTKIREVSGTPAVIRKIGGKKLKKGTYYKFRIKAVDKNGREICTSSPIYAATKGKKAKSNYTGVYVSSSKVKKASAMKKGGSLSLKAIGRLASGCRAVKYKALRYESSDSKVASVSGKGKVKAISKGTCTIYVYAQNGVYKKVKVKVS